MDWMKVEYNAILKFELLSWLTRWLYWINADPLVDRYTENVFVYITDTVDWIIALEEQN